MYVSLLWKLPEKAFLWKKEGSSEYVRRMLILFNPRLFTLVHYQVRKFVCEAKSSTRRAALIRIAHHSSAYSRP